MYFHIFTSFWEVLLCFHLFARIDSGCGAYHNKLITIPRKQRFHNTNLFFASALILVAAPPRLNWFFEIKGSKQEKQDMYFSHIYFFLRGFARNDSNCGSLSNWKSLNRVRICAQRWSFELSNNQELLLLVDTSTSISSHINVCFVFD